MSLVYCSDESRGTRGRRNVIFLGGKSQAKDRSFLESNSITHILNVTPPKEAGVQAGVPNYFESSNAFVYKRINVYDAPTSDLLIHADEVVKFISSGLCHGNVLVHCQLGVSRSTTCVAFYLLRKAGMTLKDAMAILQEKRPEAQPIPKFMEQLIDYEVKCKLLGVIKVNDKVEPIHKRRIGPSGPSREPQGPTMLHPEGPWKRAKMVGPSTVDSIESDTPSRGKHDSPTPTIGPALPPTVLVAQIPLDIGPSLPPPKTRTDDDSGRTGISNDTGSELPSVHHDEPF